MEAKEGKGRKVRLLHQRKGNVKPSARDCMRERRWWWRGSEPNRAEGAAGLRGGGIKEEEEWSRRTARVRGWL